MATSKKKPSSKKASQSEEDDEEEYDNTNTGVLFKNKRKTKKNHPDYNGSMTDSNGDEFWVAGWVKHSRKNGDAFISLAFTPKETEEEDEEDEEDEGEELPPPSKSKGKKSRSNHDDLPF